MQFPAQYLKWKSYKKKLLLWLVLRIPEVIVATVGNVKKKKVMQKTGGMDRGEL